MQESFVLSIFDARSLQWRGRGGGGGGWVGCGRSDFFLASWILFVSQKHVPLSISQEYNVRKLQVTVIIILV